VIRLQKWAGMLTYVSKYFIPPGAAQQQTNMACLLPGQLTVRGGMENIRDADGQLDAGGPCLEMYGYSIGSDSTDKLIVFTHNGNNGTIKVL
jgi:hypothetical protein